MGIYRSTNPADFDDIDGIVVAETAPPGAIQGARTNVAILVGQFQSGPADMREIASAGELYELYGKSTSYKGIVALKNKLFGALKVVRVVASDAAKATKAFASSATDRITFTAKYKGAYGNSITVKIENGTDAGKKYTITDGRSGAVLPVEVYDNVEIDAVGTTFANSKLVDVTVNSTAAEPDNAAATALASGSDGTVADTDYEDAIALCEVEGAGNVLFLDVYNATRNGYLKTHAAATQDKVCVLSDGIPATTDASTAVSDAATAVATKRDSDGRLVYAFNPPKTVIDGAETETDPASWVAAILSLTHPSIDPAFAKNTQYLAGITGLKYTLTRSQHITLKNAGICAFEYDADIGFKVKAGVTTQIADTSKLTVLRRRMADYLTQSAARYLKNYQNAVNSKDNRNAVKAAILNFVGQEERLGTLPKDSEVSTGRAKSVDTESLNTDTTIGQGFFYVLWKQRIYSSMRYIVIQAEIGETVTVSEQ